MLQPHRPSYAAVRPSTFRILDLPAELIGTICDYVEQSDLSEMRLACMALKPHSITSFGTRIFNHLIVVLHPFSLDIVLEISRHAELSKFVKRVSVSGEHIKRRITDHDKMLYDMQASMEKSGQDTLILDEAFQNFQDLRSVMIDTISYLDLPPQAPDDGLRCGRTLINPECDESEYGPFLGGEGYSWVYVLVFSTLQFTDEQHRIHLGLGFGGNGDTKPAQFDMHDESWINGLSRQVRRLEFAYNVDAAWYPTVLESATTLEHLLINFPFKSFHLRRQDKDLYHWPQLSHLTLREAHFQHGDFTAFL